MLFAHAPSQSLTASIFNLSRWKGAERLERAKGIEPSYAAWEAAVLPLNYARVALDNLI
jgi:hypothetical protein